MSYTTTTRIQLPDSYVFGTNYANGVFHSQTGNPLPTYSFLFTASRSGTRVDSFRRKIKNHEDATSNYSLTGAKVGRRRQAWTTGFGQVGSIKYTTYLWYTYKAAPPVPTLYASDDKAKERFYRNLVNVNRRVDMGETLAEAHQAKTMILNTADNLGWAIDRDLQRLNDRYRILRYVRRTPFGRASKLLSDMWLEFQFGWKPLFGTIDSAFSDILACHNRTFKVVKGSDVDSRTLSTSTTSSGFQYAKIDTLVKNTMLSRVKYTAGVWSDPPLAQRWGMSTPDIPGVVWEIIPYSFLVDYFVDISTFLSAAQYLNQRYVYCTRSTLARGTMIAQSSPVKAAAANRFVGSYGFCESSRWDYSRSSIESPGWYIPSIKFLDGFTIPRSLNIMALVRQRIHSY